MKQAEPKKEKKTPRELFEEFRRQKPSPELIDALREIKRNEKQKDNDKSTESPQRKIARSKTPPDLDL